eukprot:gene28651-31821_t
MLSPLPLAAAWAYALRSCGLSRAYATFASSPTPRVFLPVREPEVRVVNVGPSPTGSGSTGGGEVYNKFSNFSKMGLFPLLLESLEGMAIKHPSEIQAASIPAILKGGDHLIASHTGSGKTLAYLLPIAHLVKAQELVGGAGGFVHRPKRPRVLILGPTKELTTQIRNVAKSLSHQLKFRTALANATHKMSDQKRKLATPVDILVATPTRFLQHIRENNVFYIDIQWLVIDEADSMFSEGWGEELQEIIAALKKKPEPSNFVLVSATMAKPIKNLIGAEFPGINMIETSTLHKAVQGSQHKFLVSTPADKTGEKVLTPAAKTDAKVLTPAAKTGEKVLVFCNTVSSCQGLSTLLREADASGNSRGSATHGECRWPLGNISRGSAHGDMPATGSRFSSRGQAHGPPQASRGQLPWGHAHGHRQVGVSYHGDMPMATGK